MALDITLLTEELISSIGNIPAGNNQYVSDFVTPDTMQSFCNAIATAVINHIIANAVVTVPIIAHTHGGVTTGAGITAVGSGTETGEIS